MRRLLCQGSSLPAAAALLFWVRCLPRAIPAGASSGAALPEGGCRFYSVTQAFLQHRRSFQPFSAKEEEELVQVLTTKPRHVARHLRQTMLKSTRHISQFRNSVTYLMILIQGKLQRGEMDPGSAALVIQGIMAECIATRQSDMAHLLFRAAVRFKKYGVRLSTECVRILFDSYRGNQAKELMEALALELSDDQSMRALVMIAYLFAGHVDKALEVKRGIPKEDITTEDLCSLIDGFGALGRHSELVGFVREAFDVQAQVDLPAVASAAVIAARGSPDVMLDLFHSSLASGIPLNEAAISTVVRVRVYAAKTLSEIYEIEQQLRQELGTESFGLGAETAILAKCSELVLQQHCAADEIMLSKVRHLQAVIEASDEIDPRHMLALLKGYGVLGKVEEMNRLFDDLCSRHNVDSRAYDEVLRWNSRAENVKDVIRYKDEMTQRGIKHSLHTYANVFRCLDKFYPRMVEKYYNEMIRKGFSIDANMYPVLLRVFGDIGDMAMVEQLYSEMKLKSSQGLDVFTSRSSRVLLNIFRADERRCEEVIAQAAKRGHLADDHMKQALLRFYSRHNRLDDMRNIIQTMTAKTAETYRIILRHFGSINDRRRFEDTLSEMKQNNIPFDDETVRVLITSFSRWGDAARVRNVLAEVNTIDGIHTAAFYSDAAAAFARVGDMAAMDQVWDDLVDSKVSISMAVFNKFLDLYMNVNNLDKVQLILNYMMKHVPPNPVTATTVIDMLGKMGRLNEMEALLDEMSRSKNAAPTVVTFHQAMSAFAKVGDVGKVEAVRARMQAADMQESAVTYNILVEAYGRAKRYEHIPELVQERRSKGIPMEEFGYIGLINTYSRARMPDEVNDVVASLLSSGVPLNARLLSVISTAYSYLGDMTKMGHYVGLLLAHPTRRQRDVEAVFLMYSRLRDTKRLEELLETYPRTEYVYNVCISSFAKAGDYIKVASLLQEMEQRAMVLQRNTSITLSSLLLKAGKVELAQAVLNWRPQAALGQGNDTPDSGDDDEGGERQTCDGEGDTDIAEPDPIREQLEAERKSLSERQ